MPERRRGGFDPWVGKIPWRRKWPPNQHSCLESPCGCRSQRGYSPWGHKDSGTAEHVCVDFHKVERDSRAEGRGRPAAHSHAPRCRGWQASVIAERDPGETARRKSQIQVHNKRPPQGLQGYAAEGVNVGAETAGGLFPYLL